MPQQKSRARSSRAPLGFCPSGKLAPPGGCRSALGRWSQLLEAVEVIGAAPAAAGSLRTRYGPGGPAALGGPAQLLSALGSNPMYVQGENPPADIYAHFIWFTGKVAAAAQQMSARLTALPSLL